MSLVTPGWPWSFVSTFTFDPDTETEPPDPPFIGAQYTLLEMYAWLESHSLCPPAPPPEVIVNTEYPTEDEPPVVPLFVE